MIVPKLNQNSVLLFDVVDKALFNVSSVGLFLVTCYIAGSDSCKNIFVYIATNTSVFVYIVNNVQNLLLTIKSQYSHLSNKGR